MKLSEFITMTGLELDIRWTEGLGIFQVDFHNTDVKQGIMLAGWWGGGKTRESAIEEYCSRIQGETLVIHARNAAKRQEINVPDSLVYDPAEDNRPADSAKTIVEEPEIVECEIEPFKGNLSYLSLSGVWTKISHAPNKPGFIGFKFGATGKGIDVCNTPVAYVFHDTLLHCGSTIRELGSGKHTEVNATHVLFRR